MDLDKFNVAFEELTGNPPFPWQAKLFELFSGGSDSIPTRCDIPTGLGKTSVIAIWLLARESCPSLPRRLVYVVNRRTVVDQTTSEVERYKTHRPELAVSTLRGQFADNREWSADPSRTAVICGTVDMIGSRLLFSGYGVGFKGKPLHAGFLGQDSLIVHDEAHLEPAFQELLTAIQKEQCEGRFSDRHPIRVMELSATSRGGKDASDAKPPFTLTPADREHSVVMERIYAIKSLQLHPLADEKKQLADRLAELALTHVDSGRAILVFVRTIEDLGKVVAKLPKERTRQLTGTMRGLERDTLIEDPIFKRFLPKPEVGDKTVYLVCTSAGEVGVNISADHLVCDLSTFESMAQRFGRVNRFGLRHDTRVDVVHPTPATFDAKEKLTPARQRTLALLEQLNGNASSDALSKLDEEARANAFAPLPIILPTTDILYDAWSMTSIKDKLPGRPKVEPYLHGISEWEPPQTKVGWRSEVAEVTKHLLYEYCPKELLDLYPLRPHELLTSTSVRVFDTLKKLAPIDDLPVWIVDDEANVEVSTFKQIVSGDKGKIEGLTILLPPIAGGLDHGFFTPSSTYNPAVNYDVADRWTDKDGPLRSRQWSMRDEPHPSIPEKMKKIIEIAFTDPDSDDEDAKPIKTWYWFARFIQADTDARNRNSYDLDPHLSDAKKAATRFVSGLFLDSDLRAAVILAAACHDLGKDRSRWQRSIGNSQYPDVKWAKGNRWGMLEQSAYRHEFGSMLDIQSLPAFKALSDDSRELVLHLIAAHHGRARPHFTPEECLDENHRGEPARQQSIEALRRFARLQRKIGRWGLAYLESLVRAADYAASEVADAQSAGGVR